MSFRFVIPAVALGLAAPLAAAESETKPAEVTELAHNTAETATEATSPMLAMKAGERAGEAARAMLADTAPTLNLSDVIARAREAIESAHAETLHYDEATEAAN